MRYFSIMFLKNSGFTIGLDQSLNVWLRSWNPRESFGDRFQLVLNFFLRCEPQTIVCRRYRSPATPNYLPRSLMTGKESVPDARPGGIGCNRPSCGGGAVWEWQSVSPYTDPDLRAGPRRRRFLHSQKHNMFLHFLVQILTIDEVIAQFHRLFVSLQYYARMKILQCQCTPLIL